MIRIPAAIVSALILCGISVIGCGSLLPTDGNERSFFVLSDIGSTAAGTDTEKSNFRLLVRNTKASGFINSHKIIFGGTPQTRGYYQLASWVEPPPERLTLLLIERFEKAGTFASVSRLASSTLGDLQLNTEITEFYHDVSDRPGKIHIRVAAELVDVAKRIVLDSKTFTAAVTAESYDAEGAVQAFSKGISQLLDEITTWVHNARPPASA